MSDPFIKEFIRSLASIPYKGFRMVNRRTTSRYRQGVYNLAHRGILKQTNGTYHLTSAGKKWLDGQLLRHHRYRGTSWDKRWRIVIFDIPSRMERQRHSFRNQLKRLGFKMIQRSIFVIPYPCEREIADICRKLSLFSYVDIILAESILSRDEELRKVFSL